MTVDIRAAARDEAFMNHYSHKQVPDRYDADLLIEGFQAGAVWAQAQLTPTREQIARELYKTCWGDMLTWEDDNKLFYDFADTVLALLQGCSDLKGGNNRDA